MRVDLTVTLRIVALDVLKLRCILECGIVPVQMPQPLVNMGIATPDIAEIALEVLHIDRIEAHNGGVEADIGFSDGRRGKEIWGGGL